MSGAETAVTAAIGGDRAGAHDTARARVAVAAIFFVNGAAFASWVPHIPTVQARIGAGAGALGLALLAMAVGALLTMPLTGWLVGRHGSRRVVVWASLAYCLLTPLAVMSQSLSALAGALLLLGMANGAMDVSMNAHGVAVECRIARPVMSSLHALYSLGGLAGAGVAALVLGMGAPPIPHMVSIAVVSLLAVLAVWPRLLPADADTDSGAGGPRFAVPRGPLLPMGIAAFGIMMTEGAMADWSAVYLRNDLAASPAMAAAGFAAFSLTMAAGRLVGDRLVARFGEIVVVRTGAALAAAGLGTALLLHHPWAAVAGFACVGLGVANIIPVLFRASGLIPGIPSGTGIAALTTMGYCGFLAGPPLVGFAADVVGLPLALGVPAALTAMVAVRAGVLRKARL